MMGSGSHSTPRPYCRISSPLLSTSASSSSSSSGLHQYDQNISSFQAPTAWHDSHELPMTWSQLLLGDLQEEEDRCSFTDFPPKGILENWEEQRIPYRSPPTNTNTMLDLNQERSKKALAFFHKNEQRHEPIPSWGSILSPTSSPGSCISTMFDFPSSKTERKSLQQDHSAEYNSTSNAGSALKKTKVQPFLPLPTLKVRKEKMVDRIIILHQLVSPFGKTDTASVLLEVFGYIKFLQNQIQTFSSPYLDNSSRSKRQPGEVEQSVKDLRSRGLCLVPVSFTLNFGGDNGADYWASSFCGDFK